ncbi:MAG TPA: histidinol dehydrogenase [Candidatus Thermoplasmatota archaeon]|nr:histidinol dehydrogenase [Candidatus Thermoplasmatota archaeon]
MSAREPFVYAGPLSLIPGERRRALVERGRSELAAARVDVLPIWFDVRDNGDEALVRLTEKFDGARLDRLRVEDWERRKVAAELPRADREALEMAAERIRAYHEKQVPAGFETTLEDVRLGWKPVPLDRIGIYVPGGRAAYPSTLLMAAIPAKVAGVRELVVCTPPARDGSLSPALLSAAEIAGVDEIFRVGGAQAVFAMAVGTKTIRPVRKIVGPGSVYVQAAKQLVRGEVGIDGIAGPSEVLVVVDDPQHATLAAWELAAQAEHAPDAACVLVATGEPLRAAVEAELSHIVPTLPRAETIKAALARNGALLSVKNVDEALAFANEYAPEHLVLLVRDPRAALATVRSAGSVFLGPHSPVALGDYCAGTNHVLPTSGAARHASGLSVLDFVRFVQWQEATARGLARVGPIGERLATLEGLSGHAGAIAARLPRRSAR